MIFTLRKREIFCEEFCAKHVIYLYISNVFYVHRSYSTCRQQQFEQTGFGVKILNNYLLDVPMLGNNVIAFHTNRNVGNTNSDTVLCFEYATLIVIKLNTD